jgi:hydroxymethylpyrimidine pyrophosphatase-like HAD family hydrolase
MFYSFQLVKQLRTASVQGKDVYFAAIRLRKNMDDSLLIEIADLLDEGFVVFVHRSTFEVLSYPDPARWGELDAIDEYEAIRDRLEKDATQFVEVGSLPSKVSFRIMEDFVRQVADAHLRERLLEALNSRKPFRHFRQTVEGSREASAWEAFKKNQLKAYALQVLAEKWD